MTADGVNARLAERHPRLATQTLPPTPATPPYLFAMHHATPRHTTPFRMLWFTPLALSIAVYTGTSPSTLEITHGKRNLNVRKATTEARPESLVEHRKEIMFVSDATQVTDPIAALFYTSCAATFMQLSGRLMAIHISLTAVTYGNISYPNKVNTPVNLNTYSTIFIHMTKFPDGISHLISVSRKSYQRLAIFRFLEQKAFLEECKTASSTVTPGVANQDLAVPSLPPSPFAPHLSAISSSSFLSSPTPAFHLMSSPLKCRPSPFSS